MVDQVEQRRKNFFENFISNHFMSMPMFVRIIVYLLIVMTFVHNSLIPTTLHGVLWIERNSQEEELDGLVNNVPGTGYEVRHRNSSFAVNSEARWYLSTRIFFPGDISIEIIQRSPYKKIGNAHLSRPIPIWSAVYPKQYNITVRSGDVIEVTETASKGNYDFIGFFRSAIAKESRIIGKEYYKFTIERLEIKRAGDRVGSTGELYFRIELSGEKIDAPLLPGKHQWNSHILVNDNTNTKFGGDLSFAIPSSIIDSSSDELTIKIYDSDPIGGDDLVGRFVIDLEKGINLGRKVYDTSKLRRAGYGSSLQINTTRYKLDSPH